MYIQCKSEQYTINELLCLLLIIALILQFTYRACRGGEEEKRGNSSFCSRARKLFASCSDCVGRMTSIDIKPPNSSVSFSCALGTPPAISPVSVYPPHNPQVSLMHATGTTPAIPPVSVFPSAMHIQYPFTTHGIPHMSPLLLIQLTVH